MLAALAMPGGSRADGPPELSGHVTAASGAFAHHNSRARLPILTASRIVPGDVAIYRRITEETPYFFTEASQLTDSANLAATCERNRGPAGAPVFLIDHWITTDPVRHID